MVTVFIIIWFNYPRKVVKNWVLAWQANLLGLIIIYIVLTGIYDFPKLLITFLYTFYSVFKILFAIFLLNGLSRFFNNRTIAQPKIIKLIPWILIFYAIVLNIIQISSIHIQILTYIIIGAILFLGSLFFIKQRESFILNLIPFIFALEGVLFLHHAWVLLPVISGEKIPSYMTHISFLDSIFELIVGLTCLLAIIYRVVNEFQESNIEMENVQQTLRHLVDKDPLTDLWNRRRLEGYIKEQNNNCTLVFLDVDNFKAINDTWGHHVGDLCLQRIAQLFRQLLGDQIGTFRLGGDEFLAVIPLKSNLNIDMFLIDFKKKLAKRDSTPAITVSVGIKTMNEKTNFNQAMKEADKIMYQAKKASS